MKKTITSKIIISYLMVILLSLGFAGGIYFFTARSVIEKQVQRNLEQSAVEISNIITDDGGMNRRMPPFGGNMSEGSRSVQGIREAMRRSSISQGSSYAIVTQNQVLLSPRFDEGGQFEAAILPILRDKSGVLVQGMKKFYIDGIEYMSVTLPIHPRAEATPQLQEWVVVYAAVEQNNQLEKATMAVLIVALLFSGMVAVVFGVFIARSIAKPIIRLKGKAERLSKRDFSGDVEVNTADELEELAHSVNKMARELKEYDIAQKKFLQNASHELKTPLMSIQGYAEGIKDGVFEDEARALDIIVEESKRLKKLVDQVIYLSKLETMEEYYSFSRHSLNTLIEEVIEKMKSLSLMKGIQIRTDPGPDRLLNMDRDKLLQALINILGNCLRYARSEILVTTDINSHEAIITIRDDGKGFDEGEPEQLFGPFYKGKKGGSGLGLPITQVIVEKHGGTITASNSPTGGAVFTIRIEINN